MLWYKFKKIFSKNERKVMWQPREVVLDTHDNDKFNRIFTKLDHTLVIRDFQPGQRSLRLLDNNYYARSQTFKTSACCDLI